MNTLLNTKYILDKIESKSLSKTLLDLYFSEKFIIIFPL